LNTFFGSIDSVGGYGITTDGSGNVYISGYGSGTWDGPAGQSPLHAYSGNNDIFVLKLDSSGAYLWHTFYGGSNDSDEGYAVAIDGGGNVYVTGGSLATWNGPTGQSPLHAHSSPGYYATFLLKLDSSGAYQWHTFYGSTTGNHIGGGIASDSSGDVYISGFSSATWNGPTGQNPLHTHSSPGYYDILVLKLNTSGAYQWHSFYGSSSYDYGLGIGTDGSGNVYISGYSDGAWNGPAGQSPLHAYSGNADTFVLKLDSNGSYQWHTFYGSSYADLGGGIATDGRGNVYVTGFSTATWNGPAGQSPLHAHSSPGYYDVFVLKLASEWTISTIDIIEGVGGKYNSITIDSKNKAHISYYYLPTGDLKYATNASGSWQTITIDSTYEKGTYNSIAIDSNDKVHISYRDSYTPALKYATNASGSWVTSTIDNAGWGGGVTSIATDSNNKVHIVYFDNTNIDLKYATNVSGSWETFTVDSAGNVAPGASSRSIAIDSNDKVHINYYDGTNGYLKYATNTSGVWETFTIDTSGMGWISSIAVDSNNKVHIACYDDASLNLKYTTNVSGSWETSTIDSTGDAGASLSIAVDSKNKVHISYFDDSNSDLMYALKYANNVSGSWETMTIDSTGDVGWFNSIAIDSNNRVHISYYDRTNGDLKYATNATSCTLPVTTSQPQSQTIESGQTASMSVGASGTTPLWYQWYRGSSGDASNPISGATSSSYTTPILTQTTSYWVRVTNSCGSADSNTANITVQPYISDISVVSPDGGETWPAGSMQTIRWTCTGNPGPYVKIELLKGGVVNRIIKSFALKGTGGTGSCNWTIPANQAPGADYRIRVTSTTNGAYTDTSVSDFTIAAPTVTVVSPNSGETWPAGSMYTIRWNYTGNPGPYLKIELLKGGVVSRTIAWSAWKGSGGSGSRNWTIPANQVPGTDYRIRVTSTNDGAYTDTSDSEFIIAAPTIAVASPNSGETWPAGSMQTIRWSYTGNPGSYVKIELLKGGVVNRVIASSAWKGSGGTGSRGWKIPLNQAPGTDYSIRVTSTSHGAYTDMSDSDFTIAVPTITVVSPNSAETWAAGSMQTIRWSYTGNPGTYVKIELLKGGVVNRIIRSFAWKGSGGNGSYNWHIPSILAPGSDYRIRVTSTTNGAYTDTGDSDFTIQ